MMAWLITTLAVIVLPVGLLRVLRTHPAVFPYTMVLFLKGVGVFGPLFKKQLVRSQRGGEDEGDSEDARQLSDRKSVV